MKKYRHDTFCISFYRILMNAGTIFMNSFWRKWRIWWNRRYWYL